VLPLNQPARNDDDDADDITVIIPFENAEFIVIIRFNSEVVIPWKT
jgi:hypothetical protein